MGGDRWRGLRLIHGESAVNSTGSVALPPTASRWIGSRVVLAPGTTAGLRLYPADRWAVYLGSLQALPDLRHEARLLVQLLRSNAFESDIGPDREVLIPPCLRRLAELHNRVVVATAGDHLEFWNPASWAAQDDMAAVINGVA